MTLPKLFLRATGIFAVATFVSFLVFSRAADDDSAMPRNLGHGLRQLAAWHATHAAVLPQTRRLDAVREYLKNASARVQADCAGRVVVDIYLNGTVSESMLRSQLEALNATILAFEPPGHSTAARHGLFSAYLPLEQVTAIAKLPGVQSISLAHRPWHHVGAVTSRGVAAIKANVGQRRGFLGNGITVGVMSDSYDLTAPHAVLDVLRDDLPGPGNRAHRTTPVFVLKEGDPNNFSNIDEGRDLLQIVHDVAPNAALAFSTTGPTVATFANAIRSLRTDSRAHCDVLVDDIGFPDEPFFSIGVAEQAVEDVVNSTVLTGHQVLYFSAAGNEGDLGYEADFSAVSDTTARAGQAGTNNLQIDQVPTSLTAGGFHNFTPGSGVNIAQQFVVTGADVEIDFQWNDLFDANQITSDYNLLVFDQDGNYMGDLSGTDDNFSTGQALELIDLPPSFDGSDLTYQIAITRGTGGTGTAQHFRYITNTNGGLDGTYLQTSVPTTFGHSGALSGNGVGAYAFNKLTEPESFSSFGPVSHYFDAAGHRLQTPVVNQQPIVCGPDGVATSLIRQFFGTSAAAPHVAGVAALLLQAAGGPGSLSADQVRTTLENTADRHDLNPLIATAQFGSSAGMVTLTGHGDESNFSTTNPRFFTLQFSAPVGTLLQTISIDLSPAGLKFDPSAGLGFPFTVAETDGGVSSAVTAVLKTGSRGTRHSRLLLTFANFPANGTMLFGIDRDVARTDSAGNSADLLGRATVSATFLPPLATKPLKAKGVFVNALGIGYTPADGFGLVNANAALHALGH